MFHADYCVCVMWQVEKVFQYLTDNVDVTALNIQFAIDCGGGARGVYLRELHEVSHPSEVSISIEPKFVESRTGEGLLRMCYGLIDK